VIQSFVVFNYMSKHKLSPPTPRYTPSPTVYVHKYIHELTELIHLEILASDGVEQHALAAVGLNLLDCRGSEGVRLDCQALGAELDRLAILVVAADHLLIALVWWLINRVVMMDS